MHAKELQSITIAFIGGGNMSEAFVGGLCQDARYRLVFSDPSCERRDYMKQKYPTVEGFGNNDQVMQLLPQVIIFAVKPQIMKSVMVNLQSRLHEQQEQHGTLPLLISIAAGISTTSMRRWLNLGQHLPLVRLMPNTPALMGEGAAGCYAVSDGGGVTTDHRQLTESLLGVVCKQIAWIDKEPLIDAVTAVSGSGPAYFFLIMEAMQNAGMDAGLTMEDAKALTLQTCIGAAKMAMESEDDLATLRRKVTSPKGTTEAALKVLEAGNIRQLLHGAVFAAQVRSRELAEEFGMD